MGDFAVQVEVIYGSLWISKWPGKFHQQLVGCLWQEMWRPAHAAGLCAAPRLSVQLMPPNVATPDLVVFEHASGSQITTAGEVVMVGEIVTPREMRHVRHTRMHIYSAARIDWYLVAELDMPDLTLRLHRRHGDDFVEHSVAPMGEILSSDEPFAFELSYDAPIGTKRAATS